MVWEDCEDEVSESSGEAKVAVMVQSPEVTISIEPPSLVILDLLANTWRWCDMHTLSTVFELEDQCFGKVTKDDKGGKTEIFVLQFGGKVTKWQLIHPPLGAKGIGVMEGTQVQNLAIEVKVGHMDLWLSKSSQLGHDQQMEMQIKDLVKFFETNSRNNSQAEIPQIAAMIMVGDYAGTATTSEPTTMSVVDNCTQSLVISTSHMQWKEETEFV
ncbi:unnamed protein product [Linum trigynum]|uniref:Uncharacterized protein n=1 Tax=Linum trigynum TaxID=586398 RepID=A0AAV2FRX6_9ROSI